MCCFALSGHVRSAGLTTLFDYSQEKQVFYLNNNFKFLKNKKIGLIINHTSKVPTNELREYGFNSPITTFDLFKNADLNVVRIFSPEHGFSGQYAAGEEVPSTSDVVSLYGSNR